MKLRKILFCSCHGYLDPSGGAATSTRELMELFAADGVDCRVLSTGVLDYAEETAIRDVIASFGVEFREVDARLSRPIAGAWDVGLLDMTHHGVRVSLMPTVSSRYLKALTPTESEVFTDLTEQVLDRFRPDVVLTFGGHQVVERLIVLARARGIPVVFHLRNFEYRSCEFFAHASGVVVSSRFARDHFRDALGLNCEILPIPVVAERVVTSDRAPKYLTFVNPQANKGLTVFARIASELNRRRPDIPLLVVEGRAKTATLDRVRFDLSGLTNLHRMANTSDPRNFYRVSRAVLMPSLWRETFGRVAAEAMMNGIPVLASGRGALPETVGDGGFVLPIPDRCTPTSRDVPTAEEVEPWIAVIERLWDDPAWEEEQSRRAVRSASRWDVRKILNDYYDYFERIGGRR